MWPTASRPAGSGNGRLCLAPLRRQRLSQRPCRGSGQRLRRGWRGLLPPRLAARAGGTACPRARQSLRSPLGRNPSVSWLAKPSQLAGLRFVARAPLNCVEADALQFWLFRSRAVKIKSSQQNGKAQAPCQRGFSGGSTSRRTSSPRCARRVASADFCARRLFPKCCWSQVSNPRLNLAHKNRGRSPGLAHYFFLGGGGAGCLMRSFSCVAGLRSASRLVVNTPLSESRYWVCVLVPLCLFGMISPFTRLEKQQIFRFTSISRLFGRGIVLVSTGRETCLFTPRGEKFVPGRFSSAASIPPTPCELSTATAVEPAAWSSRRHRLSSMALSADR